MPSPLTPDQTQAAKDKVDELEKLARDTEAKLRQQPASDGRTTALQIMAEKMSIATSFQAKFLTGDISEADIIELERRITANLDWIRRMIRLIGGVIRTIMKGFIDILFDIFEELWSIIEVTVATIKARVKEFGKVAVEGSASSQLRKVGSFGGNLLPKNLGTVKGEFRMELAPLGLSGELPAKSLRFYRVESFDASAAEVTIGGKVLKNVRESVDLDEPSVIEVTSTGKLSGRVWTTFRTSSIKGSDDMPIHGVIEFTGAVDLKTGVGKISAKSYELVSARDLVAG